MILWINSYILYTNCSFAFKKFFITLWHCINTFSAVSIEVVLAAICILFSVSGIKILWFHLYCSSVAKSYLFAFPSSSGPCFVRTLYYDPPILDGPAQLTVSLSSTSPFTTTRLWSVKGFTFMQEAYCRFFLRRRFF